MQCPRCGSKNRESRRFCGECGTSLFTVCPVCRFTNELDEKFCGGCGVALWPQLSAGQAAISAEAQGCHSHAAPATHEASLAREGLLPERRQLTVMFCDLVGSTALSRRLDPEDLRQVIRAYQEACGAEIARFGGFVARFMGDGILAHFGYPQAHEDDAERAVRAGLAIVEAVSGIRVSSLGQHLPQCAARVGIATGLVVAGDMIGIGAAEERSVVGETPNLAGRLQGLAEPNTVVISTSTQRLLGGLFDYENLGGHQLKGFDEPVCAWQVLQPRQAASRFRAAHTAGLTPLVGRKKEIDLLLRYWEQAKRGDGQVLLLSGEAGIGKSRIVEALREHAAADQATRFRYQCSPYYINSPLYPFINQLERAAKFERGDSAEQKLNKLEKLLNEPPERAAAVVPVFAALLSVPATSRYPPFDLTPQQLRENILAALIDQIDRYASNHLVLIVFEDAHWVDPTSQELLERIVERTRNARVMVVVSFRSGAFMPDWASEAHVNSLELSPLSQQESAEMVKRVAGNQTLPKEVLEQIVDKTDGVPLFVEELTKTIMHSGLLKKDESGYALNGPLPPLAIPTTLQDSLTARLDKLALVKEVAQTGATIGRAFSYELLAAISDRSDEELQNSLVQLTQAELNYPSWQGPSKRVNYTFKHALVQDAAYASLLKTRRQQLHTRIAKVLEEQFPERVEAEPELLAHHYTEAGLAAEAVSYRTRAAHSALARSAHVEALRHVHKGLDVLQHLPDTDARAEAELQLHIARGTAYCAIKSFAASEVLESFTTARDLCKRVGDTLQLIDVLRGLYTYHYVRGELRTAKNQGKELVEWGQRTGDSRLLTVGHYMRGAIMFWQGEFLNARKELEEALTLHKPEEQRTTTLSAQIDLEVAVLNHLAWTLWVLGYPRQAVSTSERAVAVARTLPQPLTHAMVLFWNGVTRACCGTSMLEDENFRVLQAIIGAHGFAYMAACSKVLEAQALIADKQFELGLVRLRGAFSQFQAQEAGVGRPWALAVSLPAYGPLGQAEKGLTMAEQACEQIKPHGERHWEAELHRLRGDLLLWLSGQDHEAEAESCYQRALAVARHQGAKSFELRAALCLARLMQRQGRRKTAHELLSTAYGGFTEGFETADLKAANALLQALA